jgi:multidrug efflux pump subunit AcrB
LASGAPLGFVAILGVLALIGILIRNSVILDYADRASDHRRRAPVERGASKRSEHRMRPIALTAAAASAGAYPHRA